MEYQKVINLLYDTISQPSKFRTRNQVEINDESRVSYGSNNIKLKTSKKIPNLCDYSDEYIHFTATITVLRTSAAAAPVNKTNKKVIVKNCALFTTQNSTQVDDTQDIDLVMPMHNLIEYSDVYSKTSGSLWQCYRLLIFLVIAIILFRSNLCSK